MPTPADEFRLAMRNLAAGVTVVATREETTRAGLTATAVCSVSLAPPLLLACINSAGRSHDAIDRIGYFSVNLLAEDQCDIAEVFSAGRAGKFAGNVELEWHPGPQAIPMLSNCLASFACRVVNRVTAGTHTVFIGEVMEVRRAMGKAPLLYVRGNYHLLGPALSSAAYQQAIDVISD